MQLSLDGTDLARPSTRPRPGAGGGVAPLLKWPGGKSGELKQITAAMPETYDRFCEPFLGGGAVFFSLPPGPSVLNDTSRELMALYNFVQREDEGFLGLLWALERWWSDAGLWVSAEAATLHATWAGRHQVVEFAAAVQDCVTATANGFMALMPEVFADLAPVVRALIGKTVPKKLERMRKVETDRAATLPAHDVWANIEGAYKAVIYTAIRDGYNRGRASGRSDAMQAALFFYLREYAYAAMFRFNSAGAFNVPYGGVSYNRKDMASKIKHMQSPDVLQRLKHAKLECEDFGACLAAFDPQPGDFMFLDPPYDSDFSEYDRNPFGASDHRRLGQLLETLPCQFMLVIKASPLIESLYPVDRFAITAFDKTYMWTIKERNDREATHLMITNYDPAVPAG